MAAGELCLMNYPALSDRPLINIMFSNLTKPSN